MFPREMGEVYAQCYPVPCSIPDIVPQGNSQYGSVKLAWKPCLQCGIGPMSLAKRYRRRRVSTSEVLGVAAKNSLDLAGEGMGTNGRKRSGKSARRRLITSKFIEHGPSSHATQ
ncbi:uncharacterized protein BO88DRAFT_18838 [Aspergillus vadensis CBS 113365]|uniref:Uncharacterized protein n=1 Tax=Aspergillus vadensis (strain CBS 113365 / IMI 142717 / IBT 24658) TaxID=1448311 RepID=A0A319BMW3_ASPVC|nr:hypothetical protein BO88DRAFT_18838 [Aspergillus vadensis CBS 113365]PYH74656.1 hypothetical protein BO88DRAFT_18838 [Aspergillus vadensis CBS 113365]